MWIVASICPLVILAHGFSSFEVKQEEEQIPKDWTIKKRIILSNSYFQVFSFQSSQLEQRSVISHLLSAVGRKWDKTFCLMGMDGLFGNGDGRGKLNIMRPHYLAYRKLVGLYKI